MTELALIRADEINLPLFLHVLAALTLIGATALVFLALAGSWRSGSATGMRLAFRSLLYGVIPAWLVMRITAQWLLDEQGLEDADLAWVDIGFMAAEPVFLLLIIATLIAGRRSRAGESGNERPSIGGKFATVLVGISLLAFLFALWAMTTKPV